jgi:hypothetical protein
MNKIRFFPIILFSYNRPIHLKKVLNALEFSYNITRHDIFLFNDGPKNNNDRNKIEIIKKIVDEKKEKKILRFVKIFYKNKNIGLADSIISGLKKIFLKHKAAIVIEDDIVVDKHAIKFINFYLNQLNTKKEIGSVSGHSYLDKLDKLKNIRCYLSKRHSSWAWGTWAAVWNRINWKDLNNINTLNIESKSLGFSRLGKDMNLLLWAQSQNYINSWAIRFNYFCHLNNLKSFQPRYSLVKNIGHDGSGTHGFFKSKSYYSQKSIKKSNFIKNCYLTKSRKMIDLYIENSHKKSIKLTVLYLLFLLKKNFNKIIKIK